MQTILQIASTPIRLDAFEPRTPGPHPAVMLLHGAGGNANFWLDQIVPLLAPLGIAVYATHYFDRTHTTRADLPTVTDGVHVPLWIDTIQQALAHIAARPTVDPTRIALVGISLGAFLSLALATLPGTPPLKAVVEISGGLVPPYDANATSAFPPTLILHGDADTVVAPLHAHNLEMVLTNLGVAHQIHIYRAETHWFTDAAQHHILTATTKFLSERL